MFSCYVSSIFNNYSTRACWIWDDYSRLSSHIQQARLEWLFYLKRPQNAELAKLKTLQKLSARLPRTFLARTWRHYFLKSKPKAPTKLLSSSGIRGGKLLSIHNFSAQWLASSGNQRILNFECDIATNAFVGKCILISRFLAKSKVLEKVLM